MEKNERIKNSIKATRERHAAMKCRVYEVKIIKGKLSHEKKEHLDLLFLEAKWQYNATLAAGDVFTFDRCPSEVVIKCGDGFEARELTHLGSQMKQDICDNIKSTIRGLATKKKRGEKVGTLKFKSYKNSVPLRQYGNTYRIDRGRNTITIQNFRKPFKVRGLKQIPVDAEFANAKLVRKLGGFYFHITVYEPKKKLRPAHKSMRKKLLNRPYKYLPHKKCVGIDFGIGHNLTTTDGELIDICVPESKAVKLASKRVNKAYAKTKDKTSSNHKKRVQVLRRAYERDANRKQDMANKTVHDLTSEHSFIAIQDEMISGWHKGLFGKQVQHSAMGAIKAKLKTNSAVHVVEKSYPSTQVCPVCGKNTKHPLEKRYYRCEHCGYYHPSRDIKSAAMILIEALNKVCAEHTAQSPVEAVSSTMDDFFAYAIDVLHSKVSPMKQEAQVL